MNRIVDKEEVSFNIQAKEMQHNTWAHLLIITTTEGTKAIKQRQTIIIIIAVEIKLQEDRSTMVTNRECQDRRLP